jgi:L-alanine-DL-glutamate epimerase-like enolase superfamily enzyme
MIPEGFFYAGFRSGFSDFRHRPVLILPGGGMCRAGAMGRSMEDCGVKIVRVETVPVRPVRAASTAPAQRFFERPRLTPSSALFEIRDRQHADRQPVAELLVKVVTDDGLEGIGTAGAARGHAQFTIENHLRHIVLGQDPFNVELLWERMFRETVKYGRKGMAIEAISPIDIAIWDILGKAAGQPVFNLLGGRTRDTIRAYASALYPTGNLDDLGAEARGYIDQGFSAMKLRLGWGPADGTAGMRRNLELVRTVRQAAGPDIEVAADAHMGWNVSYAIRMIHLIEDAGFQLAWVEEPVMPDDIPGYARVAAEVDTPIAGGEHEFTRYGFRDLIAQRAVDIVQLDVNRAGGITEACKIWALAAAHDLPVIPHGGHMHNCHLIMSHLNSPMAEYFPPPPPGRAPDSNEMFWHIFTGEPKAERGRISLPDRPGLGIEVNWDFVGCPDHASTVSSEAR